MLKMFHLLVPRGRGMCRPNPLIHNQGKLGSLLGTVTDGIMPVDRNQHIATLLNYSLSTTPVASAQTLRFRTQLTNVSFTAAINYNLVDYQKTFRDINCQSKYTNHTF